MGKKIGILFGINYHKTPRVRLRGCIDDVNNVKSYLNNVQRFDEINMFTDYDRNCRTTARGILSELQKIGKQTKDDTIDLVWIHFSGHGCQVKSKTNEIDGKDECIVPSDYYRSGVLPDNILRQQLLDFNPRTKIICVFDCCHSGSIIDLKYKFKNDTSYILEHHQKEIDHCIISISGCEDFQTSADAFNVNNLHRYSGAMTSCLLSVLKQTPDVQKDIFQLIRSLKQTLSMKGFSQIPQLCSSKKIDNSMSLL